MLQNLFNLFANIIDNLHLSSGMVCFCKSHLSLESAVTTWCYSNMIHDLQRHMLVFIETQDDGDRFLALLNYMKVRHTGVASNRDYTLLFIAESGALLQSVMTANFNEIRVFMLSAMPHSVNIKYACSSSMT